MPGQRASEGERREQILNAAYAVALRAGIDGVTVRAVAAEAGLSHALVIFYFKQKDQVIAALLDRVLATTALLALPPDFARPPSSKRLRALVRQEMERLARRPQDFRLFLEYWALGAREPSIRKTIAAALQRYRDALRALAEAVLRANPDRRQPRLTPDGIAAVAVSLISGCAMQAMIDPDSFDMDTYLGAVQGVLEPKGASGRSRQRP